MTEVAFTVNNLWILIATVLVFVMHLGFSMLEAGFVRKKNTVNILFKNAMIIAIGLLSYFFIGFNLMYPDEALFGGLFGFDGFGLRSPLGEEGLIEWAGGSYAYYTDFIFQAMFAATCATIVSGAVAERMKLMPFLAFTLVFISLFILLQDLIIQGLNAGELGIWFMLIPLSLVFTGITTALNYYSNRLQKYHIISQSRIMFACIVSIFSVIFGLAGYYFGLLLSSLLASVLTSIWLIYKYRSVFKKKIMKWNIRKKILIKRYRDFPIYNASTSLLDGISVALPVFVLSVLLLPFWAFE